MEIPIRSQGTNPKRLKKLLKEEKTPWCVPVVPEEEPQSSRYSRFLSELHELHMLSERELASRWLAVQKKNAQKQEEQKQIVTVSRGQCRSKDDNLAHLKQLLENEKITQYVAVLPEEKRQSSRHSRYLSDLHDLHLLSASELASKWLAVQRKTRKC